MRQLLFHVTVIESNQQRTNDDDLKLRRLTTLDQVAIKLIIVDFDVKKTNDKNKLVNYTPPLSSSRRNLLERHSAALFGNLIKTRFQIVDPQNTEFALLRRDDENVVHCRAHRGVQH